MAEKWRKYESLMIFAPEVGTDGAEDLVQKARDFVRQEAGRILKTERWGWRDMAFELKGRRKGYYLLLEFAGLPAVATELERRLNLIDTVLKFQTVKLADALDPESLPDEEVDTPPAAESASEEAAPTADDDAGAESSETPAAAPEGDASAQDEKAAE